MNYDQPIRFLARVFLEAPPSLTAARTIANLSHAFGDVELTLTPRTQVSLITGDVANVVSLSTADNLWLVSSKKDSIDLECLVLLDESRSIHFDVFLRRAGDILSLLTSKMTAHRLAVVSEGLLRDMSESEMQNVARCLLRFPPRFEPAPFEWDWRCAASSLQRFANNEVDVNTIITAKRLVGTIERPAGKRAIDNIRIDFDINTSPKNATLRFDGDAVVAFFEKCRTWHRDLRLEMGRFLGVAES